MISVVSEKWMRLMETILVEDGLSNDIILACLAKGNVSFLPSLGIR
jgi:hypothetical protein